MSADVVVAGRFDIGGVVGRSFAVARRNIAVFGLLTVVLGVAPSLLVGFLYLSLGGGDGYNSGENIVSTLSTIFLQGAIIHGVLREQGGRKVTFGDCLTRAGQLFAPLFGIGFIAGLGFLLGLVLLIVPGLMIATAWSVAGAARVSEGPGVRKALQRSQDLTKGNRWRVFGLFVLVWGVILLVAVGLGVVLALGGLIEDTRSGADVVVEAVITGVAAAIPSIFAAVTYLELRGLRDGTGSESLAEVFA